MSDGHSRSEFSLEMLRLFSLEAIAGPRSPRFVSNKPYFVAYFREVLKLAQQEDLDARIAMTLLREEIELRKHTFEELLALQAIPNPNSAIIERMVEIVDDQVKKNNANGIVERLPWTTYE